MDVTAHAPGVIGREREAARLSELLSLVSTGSAACVLIGEPGIGKTTLWRHAETRATDEGWIVLSARPAEAERELAFSVLSDLLRGQHERLGTLPPPQRRALATALGVEEARTPPSPKTMGLALLGLVEDLAAARPVLLAVDDAQWIDGSSANAMAFAIRRLWVSRVRVLITARSDSWESVMRRIGIADWPSELVATLPIGSLSASALGHLIHEALDLRFPRPVLRRLEQLTHGNPYHALQVAPLLAEAPTADPWSLPVPSTPAAAILMRLRRLSASLTRDLGVLSAASPQTLENVREAGPPTLKRSIAAAVREGVLEVSSGQPRFSHPLISSVLYAALSREERNRAHLQLADLAVDPSERARHRALAAVGPDESVAVALAAAAKREEVRGAPEAAGALLELAARMSPDAHDGHRRLIASADAYEIAGLVDRAKELLRQVRDDPRARAQRHRAQVRLITLMKALSQWETHLTEVLSDGSLEPSVRAEAHNARADARFNAGDVFGAVGDAEAALTNAEGTGDLDLVIRSAVNLASLQTYTAPPLPEPLNRASALAEGVGYLAFWTNPQLVISLRHLLQDRIARARAGLAGLIELATQRGDDSSVSDYHFHACEVEVRAGQFTAAERHAQLALENHRALGSDHGLKASLFAAGLAAAHLGRIDAARRFATEGLAISETLGDWIFSLQNATALGFIDLSVGDSDAAAARLGVIPEQLLSHGFREPSHISAWPNAIEALLQTGQIDRAAGLASVYSELAEEFDSPWARATGRRCNGLLAAARGDLQAAGAMLREAADTDADLVSPFERARTLTALGTVLRRQRMRREAREVLGQARQMFASLGAVVWAERARQEAARIRGRQSDLPGLSVTELSVARMVADGHTNREIAAALFMAERTVEANLSRIYTKLGIRSRTDLTRWMADRSMSRSQ